MTFQEAKDYAGKYLHIISQQSKLESFPYRIKCFLIAPKTKSFKERMNVLNLSLHTTTDNEGALRQLGFLNENLDIYIIGGEYPNCEEMFLSTYLFESGQES
jgi:hypothetical protein